MLTLTSSTKAGWLVASKEEVEVSYIPLIVLFVDYSMNCYR
jgi:hypothetical protein